MINKIYKLSDKKNKVLSISSLLPLVINLFNSDRLNSMNWKLFYIDAIGDLGEGKDIRVFEDEVNQSKNGILFNWNEIKSLLNKFEQIIDLTIVGEFSSRKIVREPDNEYHQLYDTVIELIDSSYWLISSKDKIFQEKILNNAPEVYLDKSEY